MADGKERNKTQEEKREEGRLLFYEAAAKGKFITIITTNIAMAAYIVITKCQALCEASSIH